MADESRAYQANAIAAACHCTRLLWAFSTNGKLPDPETDHRIGIALSGLLSDELIAGHEAWAVPTIVGAGSAWHTHLSMVRAARGDQDQIGKDSELHEEGDDYSDDDDDSDSVAVDPSDDDTLGDDNDRKEESRSGYRRRRRD